MSNERKPTVSVIIPNYNYEAFIEKTIDSVLSQTYEAIEVVVVDDGSRDNSLEVLRKYGEKIKVVSQSNQGVSTARNKGVSESKGEYLAFLDADDLWLPSKLQREMERFFERPDFGLVHCSVSYIDPQGQIIGENRNGNEGWLASDILTLRRGAVIGAGSTSVVRRSVFDEVDGFDSRLSTSADWEFCYRVASKYCIGFVDEPLVQYRMHTTNMHSNIAAMEHDLRLGFEKAFADQSSGVQGIRSDCLGNFHYLLAGSYYRTGKYYASFINILKSLWYKPQRIGDYLALPDRQR